MRPWQWVLGSAGIALSLTAQGHDYKQGAIVVGHPYARATVAGQPVGGGYLKFENKGKTTDTLISVTADVSQLVELHSMVMDGDIARMRQVEAIEIPAGKTVELKPGGLHIMFMGLKAPLKEGTSFPATLKFEKAGELKVEVKVEGAAGPALTHQH